MGGVPERPRPGWVRDRRRARDALGGGGALRQPGRADRGRAGRAGRLRGADHRRPAELADDPNPFAEPGDHGIAYTNVSFIDPAAAPPDAVSTLAEDYLQMLDRYRQGVAEAMTAVASAPEGAVLIHCAAGKDRTGLISALLLGLAGVPAETIAADYAMTAELLRPREREWLEGLEPEERAEREAMLARYAPTAEVMSAVLDGLAERFGGVEPYLLATGLGPDDLDRLRDRLVAPAGPR
jgi:protein-tyrosine phosphatase